LNPGRPDHLPQPRVLARVKRVPPEVIDRVARPRITDAMPVMEATEAIAWVEGAPIATSDRRCCGLRRP